MVSIDTRRTLAAGLFAVIGFGAAGCGDSGSDTTPPSSVTPAPTQAAQVPTVSVPTTAPTTAPTATGKTPGKKKGHGQKTGKGSQTAAPVTSPGPVVTRVAQTAAPAQTPDPNALHVRVTVTSGAITVDPTTLPTGRNVIFDIFGKSVGSKGTATFYSGGQVYGVARVVPRQVHMPTPPLVKGKLKIVIAGSPAISVKGTSVPVT